MTTLDEHYQSVLAQESPIREHLETLRELASQCAHVTEFGAGLSTIALLAGRPQVLVSYDALLYKDILYLHGLAETEFVFREADTATVVIEPTDMLFVDTKHTAEQVYAELNHNADKVRRWLVLHDTVSCGDVDPLWPGPPLGLLWGIGRYMLEHPDMWYRSVHYVDGNGLTVYERL